MAKMIAITGNTYPVKDRLKALGGRWDGDKKAWMVPADMADEANRIVGGAAKSMPAATQTSPTRRQRRAPLSSGRDRRIPDPGPGETYIESPSRGGYEIGRCYHFPRVAGGGGPNGHYFVAVREGERKHTQYTDDTREGEWYSWAHVRPATDAEAAPVIERVAQAAAKKVRSEELQRLLTASYSVDSRIEKLPDDCAVLWQAARMGGSETWYGAPDGAVYYVRSDYDMGPITWRTTMTPELIAEAKNLGLKP